MRKKIASFLLFCIVAIMLCACGKPFECYFCGEEKTGRSHEVNFLGEDVYLCDECYSGMQDLASGMFGN